MKNKSSTIQRGQAITFRLPSDTPDHILKQLQKIKEKEKRNFSSTIARFALEGVKNTLIKDREAITIPLPKQLTPEQKSWLRHSHSEMLIGTIVYELLQDPVKATALYASLSSNSSELNEPFDFNNHVKTEQVEKTKKPVDDLDNFDISQLYDGEEQLEENENEEIDGTELLSDFITMMNK